MSVYVTRPRAAKGLDDMLAALNGASVKIYTGAPPASCDLAPTGTLLSTCAVQAPGTLFTATDTTTMKATGVLGGGIFATDPSPAAHGTMGYWRFLDSAGNVAAQGTVSATGGGGDLQFPDPTTYLGSAVVINSFWIMINGCY